MADKVHAGHDEFAKSLERSTRFLRADSWHWQMLEQAGYRLRYIRYSLFGTECLVLVDPEDNVHQLTPCYKPPASHLAARSALSAIYTILTTLDEIEGRGGA